MIKKYEIVDNDLSDGYHTFNELYDHRIALFLRLCEECDFAIHFKRDYLDWFCVYLQLPEGQISYHVPKKYIDRVIKMGAIELGPDDFFWDLHEPKDVIARLNKEATK